MLVNIFKCIDFFRCLLPKQIYGRFSCLQDKLESLTLSYGFNSVFHISKSYSRKHKNEFYLLFERKLLLQAAQAATLTPCEEVVDTFWLKVSPYANMNLFG